MDEKDNNIESSEQITVILNGILTIRKIAMQRDEFSNI
jgi:hypothetical protein